MGLSKLAIHAMRQLRICRSFCLNFKPVCFFFVVSHARRRKKAMDNFVELLISEVQNRPILWNKWAENYKNIK